MQSFNDGPVVVTLYFEGQALSADEGDSVLKTLLREGFAIPNSCGRGRCQSCLLRSQELPPATGLSESRRQAGEFLSCQCVPEQDMHLERVVSSQQRLSARVERHQRLCSNVLELTLVLEKPTRWQPGETALLWRDESTFRPYSITSHPLRDGVIRLQIRRHPQGEVSRWCHDRLKEGDAVELSPPGEGVVYQPGEEQPLVLVACGTGVAPLWGVLNDLVAESGSGGTRAGDVNLFWHQGECSEPYLAAQLDQWQHSLPWFHWHRVEGADAAALLVAALQQKVPSLRGQGVMVGGPPALVDAVNRYGFMAGLNRSQLQAVMFE